MPDLASLLTDLGIPRDKWPEAVKETPEKMYTWAVLMSDGSTVSKDAPASATSVTFYPGEVVGNVVAIKELTTTGYVKPHNLWCTASDALTIHIPYGAQA